MSLRVQQFVVPGRVASGKNSRRLVTLRTGRRLSLKSKAATAWRAHAVAHLALQRARLRLPTLTDAVRVDCVFWQRTTNDADGDNMQSSVWDALVAARVIADDDLVIVWTGTKRLDRAQPRVEITITPLPAAGAH